MKPVTVYTRPLCPYCARAMSLLAKKGATVSQVCAAFNSKRRKEMTERSNGARTYPQIFIGEMHIGGCDELMALESAGELDALLDG